ncbi:hypothetical protein [Novosphingobium sp. TH158]|uniref:hypothetical protein n=1 Tax=Novosphingobium sp. TH158 TaxID=2067455 RepID=UPI0013045585|nr:hypothetical protein [Novosphingobium sp. TH158]
MSKKLAFSSALSVLLMAGFAVLGGKSVELGSDAGAAALVPERAELLQLPALPEMPILR